jgi:Protein of unknown function (DUF732)
MLPRPASETAEPDRLERCDLPIPGSCRPQSIGQIGPEFQNRRELTARADHTVLSVRADHNGGDASRRGERGLRPAALVPVGPQGAVLMVCPYCGSDVGSSGVCEKCGAPREDVKLTGWRPDPTARHEGRYYVAGRPTSRVRNGRAEANDPAGGQMLPNYVDLPSRSRMSIRWSWLGTGVGAAIIVMVALVFWALRVPDHRQSESPDAIYLSTLQDAGLAGQFNFDANAIAHGKHVCRQLDDGGPQQGLAADKIAVDAFCPRFSKGFHIFETVTVTGTFVLTEGGSNAEISSIASDGTSCHGVDGYSDIDPNTQVIVRNGTGEILHTTPLGEGHGDDLTCTFSFGFPVTEGQDRYVVSVSRRGDFIYTFNQ